MNDMYGTSTYSHTIDFSAAIHYGRILWMNLLSPFQGYGSSLFFSHKALPYVVADTLLGLEFWKIEVSACHERA